MADLTPAAFGALGPGARAAIPDLLQIVQSSSPDPRSHSQSRALLALTRIGPPAHPAIFSLLTHTNLQTRYQAVFRIRGFGSNAAPAIPVLIDALTQPPAYFQAAVAETLGRLRIEPATAVPTLLSAARSDDPDLRTAALKALARFGPDARPALPLLLEAWQTPGNDPKLRGAIEDALLLLAPDAITSAPLR
jgi:HEAT repeat protein